MKLKAEDDILWGSVSNIVNRLASVIPESQSLIKSTLLTQFADLSNMADAPTLYTQNNKGLVDEGLKAILVGAETIHESLKYAYENTGILEDGNHSNELGRFIDSLRQGIDCLISSMRVARSRGISGIYVIVDPDATKGRDVFTVAEKAIKGGVSVIQYRDKSRDKSFVMAECLKIAELCGNHDVTFVVNDSAEIAKLVGADFLHVGQSDLPVLQCRTILSSDQCIGKSNDGVEEVLESEKDGVDYLAVGAVYSTDTMGKSHRVPVGPEGLVRVKESTSLPVVAIGGINESNLEEVSATGVDSASIVSAITMADDPEKGASNLVGLWNA